MMSENHCDGNKGCIFWNDEYPCSKGKRSPNENRRLACGFYQSKYYTIEEINMLIIDEFIRTSQDPNKGKYNSPHEGMGVLLEEWEEFKDEVKANNAQKACDEAIQIAASAMRFVFDFGKQPKEFNHRHIDCTSCEFANQCLGFRVNGCRKYPEKENAEL